MQVKLHVAERTTPDNNINLTRFFHFNSFNTLLLRESLPTVVFQRLLYVWPMQFNMIKYLITLLLSVMALTSNAVGNDAPNNHEITIMTYNVKMLPRGATFLHHHPVIRARLIPAKLLAESPDVIVFEEAFDGAAIRAIKKRLKATYPYMAGQHNRRVVTYKRAGGVLIFSKYPLKELESIAYSKCKGADCLGHKGSILVEVEHPVQKFQLLGTHIQAGSNFKIKTSQYQEAAALVERHTQPGIPQFIAGDFNTHKDDTILYTALLSTIKEGYYRLRFCKSKRCPYTFAATLYPPISAAMEC
jgi:endonuclease/exonuclease/phosphatase family metal-dependent hydrolase